VDEEVVVEEDELDDVDVVDEDVYVVVDNDEEVVLDEDELAEDELVDDIEAVVDVEVTVVRVLLVKVVVGWQATPLPI
jgi:hypothetical protein